MGPRKSLGSILLLIAAALYLTLVVLILTAFWAERYGDWATASGFVVGRATFPIVIVYLYYKARRKGASAARILTVLATWILIANAIGLSRARPIVTEADIPVIAREAAGLVPISDPDNQARTVMRNFFSEMISENRSYLAKVKTLDAQGLGTPASYCNRRTTKNIIATIEATLDLEKTHEAMANDIVERFRAKLSALARSHKEKEELLKGLEEGYTKVVLIRQPVLQTEFEWLESLHDLYIFAQRNQRYFHTSRGIVVIDNSQVRDQFNKRSSHVDELGDKFNSALAKYEEAQQKRLAELGVSARDFGLGE